MHMHQHFQFNEKMMK